MPRQLKNDQYRLKNKENIVTKPEDINLLDGISDKELWSRKKNSGKKGSKGDHIYLRNIIRKKLFENGKDHV